MAGNNFRFIFLLLSAFSISVAPAFAQSTGGASFFDDFDTFSKARWYVSDGWANGEWQNCTWATSQVSATEGRVVLSFEKKPYKDRQYSCAEIQTTGRYGYGVYEARMKTDQSTSGLNSAFFSYTNSPHDEIDFEVLMKDTSKVSLNTYVSGEPKHGRAVAVSPSGTTQFNHYAFVWEEGRLRWFINGTLVHEATGTDLPTHPQKIFFSFWGSDTFTDWLGTFADPGRKLQMEVDWVAFTALGEECQFPESIACNLQ